MAAPVSASSQLSPGAPRLSFIMPLYNCLPLTQRGVETLLRSILASLRWELLLVDDGSTDGTREWLTSLPPDPRVRIFLNETNRGYAGSNNRAAREARGELLLLVNNDLVFPPYWLPPLLATQRRHPRAIIGNVQYQVTSGALDHAGIEINLKAKPEHCREFPPTLARCVRRPAATGACLLLPRALWEELGGFDEGFVNGGEDVDLCFRAARLGAPTWVCLSSRLRHHVSSSPNRKLRDEANSARLFRLWRTELSRLALPPTVLEYLAGGMTAEAILEAPAEHLHLLAFAFGLTSFPPPSAVRILQQRLALEEARWHELGV